MAETTTSMARDAPYASTTVSETEETPSEVKTPTFPKLLETEEYNNLFIKYSERFEDFTRIRTSNGYIVLRYSDHLVRFRKYNLKGHLTYEGTREEKTDYEGPTVLRKREDEIVERAKKLEGIVGEKGIQYVNRGLNAALARECQRQKVREEVAIGEKLASQWAEGYTESVH